MECNLNVKIVIILVIYIVIITIIVNLKIISLSTDHSLVIVVFNRYWLVESNWIENHNMNFETTYTYLLF